MTQRRTWLILLLAVIALRLPDLGNPLVDLDEQMYLLVGRRMWDGAIPYVDIWDRKPIGLFLLYAATQLLPVDPIVAYQLVASAAAVGTAGLIAHLVRHLGAPRGALPAGLTYVVWLELIGGRGGQSPVFYNGLIAAAGVLIWHAIADRRRTGAAAMLLVGFAIQIKPTVVFEGMLFGLILLLDCWRTTRSATRVIGAGIAYSAIAFAPTLLAYGAYAAAGHGDAWWFANVDSIFLRRVSPDAALADRLIGAVLVLAIPLVVALRGMRVRQGRPRWFIAAWVTAALLGWLAVPPYFNHYALPLLVPIAIAAGLALDRAALRGLTLVGAGGLLVLSGFPHRGVTAEARRHIAMLASATTRHVGAGCPFVFDAPPALYTAGSFCLPTRYPFPPHLTQASERGAIGIDPAAEVARILAGRPPVIITGHPPRHDDGPIVALVDHAVAVHYRPVAHQSGVTVYARSN